MAVKETLDENRRYLLAYRQELIAKFLSIPRGSIKRKRIKGQHYVYLQRRDKGRIVDSYAGKADDPDVVHMVQLVSGRPRILSELKTVRESLRGLSLTASQVARQDFTPELRALFVVMDQTGLWEAGLEIVGSWCFTFYQQYFGVRDFPVRTLDLDISIPLPYRGPENDLSGLLRRLGFEERYQYATGVATYAKAGFEIELLGPERGKSRAVAPVDRLRVNTQLLRFMDILLDNKIYVTIHGAGKVAIPSMPAFLVHKLLVAPRRKQQDKMRKDLQQAWEVARTIWQDDECVRATQRLVRKGLLPSWLATIRKKSVPLLVQHVVREKPQVDGILGRLGIATPE